MNGIKKIAIVLSLNLGFAMGQGIVTTIHLITTNDLHGVIGEQDATFMNPEYPPKMTGGAAINKYVSDLRKELAGQNSGVLILDGGNFFQGHPFGIYDDGQSMLEWMNGLGYTALVPGQYDFILGADKLNALAEAAEFPFLASNLICNGCSLTSTNFKPYIIHEVAGVKLGILGVVSSNIINTVLRQNIPGIETLTEVQALRKWLPEVREAGADIIICLTSAGEPYDREEVYADFIDSMATTPGWNPVESPLSALEMCYFAEGVDIMITGGVSRSYPEPWYDPNSHTYLFQNYGGGTEIGHIILEVDTATRHFIGYQPAVDGRVTQSLLADDFEPDYTVRDWIRQRVNTATNAIYNSPKIFPLAGVSPGTWPELPDNWDFPDINRDDQIEIMTWNVENFPHKEDTTITALAEAVHDLNPDIIAFQEIRFAGRFSDLMDYLPEYDFVISRQSSFLDQAIIFKKDLFTLERQLEIFAEDDYNFAGRPPLQADFSYFVNGKTVHFSVINLHMKCCDSGLKRRQNAVQMLHDYLAEQWNRGQRNFVVLGDWNDDLKDAGNAHGFHPFFDDDRFYFVNRDLVYDLEQASYPKEPYVSFLDHILVTDQFVPRTSTKRVQTLRLGDYMGGYSVYEDYISDHQPVMVGFPVE
ncbi:MAG: endonuclease/exonuclease/phosphatase family protein [Candidatus Neomarinimicrobiota bacterium]